MKIVRFPSKREKRYFIQWNKNVYLIVRCHSSNEVTIINIIYLWKTSSTLKCMLSETLISHQHHHFNWKLTCSHHEIAENMQSWCKTTITNSLISHFLDNSKFEYGSFIVIGTNVLLYIIISCLIIRRHDLLFSHKS
jgi:hypothetical protein